METRRCYVCGEHKSLKHYTVSDAGTLYKKCEECRELATYGPLVRRELKLAHEDAKKPKETQEERVQRLMEGVKFEDSKRAKKEPRGKPIHNMWAAYPIHVKK